MRSLASPHANVVSGSDSEGVETEERQTINLSSLSDSSKCNIFRGRNFACVRKGKGHIPTHLAVSGFDSEGNAREQEEKNPNHQAKTEQKKKNQENRNPPKSNL